MNTKIKNKTIRQLLVGLLSILLTSNAGAAGVFNGGGGGDPEAAEFAQIMLGLADAIRTVPSLTNKISAEAFHKVALDFTNTMNDSDPSNDKILFTNDRVIVDGVEKVGKFENGKITVNRNTWLEYKKNEMPYRMQAIVLLEGMLALGVTEDRYKSAGSILSFETSDIDTYSKITRLGASDTIKKKTCDWIATNETDHSSIDTSTTNFDFKWKIGKFVYSLSYLLSAESVGKSLPVLTWYKSKIDRASGSSDSIVTANSIKVYYQDSQNSVGVDDSVTLVRDLPKGITEYWSVKDGKPDQLLSRSVSQMTKGFKENVQIISSESREENIRITSICQDEVMTSFWQKILFDEKVDAFLRNFKELASRAANTKISFELCQLNKDRNCGDLEILAQKTAQRAELAWNDFSVRTANFYKEKKIVSREEKGNVSTGHGGTPSLTKKKSGHGVPSVAKKKYRYNPSRHIQESLLRDIAETQRQNAANREIEKLRQEVEDLRKHFRKH